MLRRNGHAVGVGKKGYVLGPQGVRGQADATTGNMQGFRHRMRIKGDDHRG